MDRKETAETKKLRGEAPPHKRKKKKRKKKPNFFITQKIRYKGVIVNQKVHNVSCYRKSEKPAQFGKYSTQLCTRIYMILKIDTIKIPSLLIFKYRQKKKKKDMRG